MIINKISKNKLVTDSFWALIGTIISKGLVLFSGIFIASFLGSDVYGEFGVIKTTLLSFAVFSSVGLGYTANKYIAEYKLKKPEYLYLIIKYCRNITFYLSFLLSIIVCFFSPYICTVLLNAENLTSPLRLISLCLVFSSLNVTQTGIISGFGKFKELAKINTKIGLITFVLSILLTYIWGMLGALLSVIFTQILNFILNYKLIDTSLNNLIKTRIDRDIKLLKKILIFSLPVSLQESIYSLTSWVFSLLIIKYSTYSELGIYHAAVQWSAMILFIPGIMRNVILSHLTQNLKENDTFNQIIKLTIKINLISTLIPAIIIFFCSNYFVIIYGESYNGIERLLNITVFTTIFISVSNVFAQIYMSKELNWIMLLFRVIRDVGILVMFFGLHKIKLFNSTPENLLFSVLFLNIIFLIIMVYYYKKRIQCKD